MPCDTSPEILCDNVSAKYNGILFGLLLYPHNHTTPEPKFLGNNYSINTNLFIAYFPPIVSAITAFAVCNLFSASS